MHTFENFTTAAQASFESARTYALRAGYPFLTPEYVLMGIAEQDASIGAQVLQKSGVEVYMLFEELSSQPKLHLHDETKGQPEPSKRLHRIISMAYDAANIDGKELLNTGHLLIGIVREGTSNGAQFLAGHGVTMDFLDSTLATLHENSLSNKENRSSTSRNTFPIWAFPPADESGSDLSLSIQLAKTATASLIAHQFKAYPTGVEFHTTAAIAKGNRFDDLPFSFMGLPYVPSRIEMSVTFTSGGRADVLPIDPSWPELVLPLAEPVTAGITLIAFTPNSQGTPATSHRRIDAMWWLWPLPPPEVITFSCRWHEHGIQNHTVAVDGDMFRTASRQSKRLFED